MSNIAIITARGGSKRIPGKNIKDFHGKPIIAYSIETAVASGLFDMVMVSTDDEQIEEVSKNCGAEVPFLRSEKNANDHASTADVIVEVLEQLKGTGKQFEYACCIYPTASFITIKSLNDSLDLLKKNQFDSVFPVCSFSYPIQRALKMEDGKIGMIWPENLNKRSQDLPATYHDAGQFYWVNTASFLKQRQLFTSNSGAIILNETEVQDIDNESDWKLAEMKYALLNKLNA